jgi:hypothetical protein
MELKAISKRHLITREMIDLQRHRFQCEVRALLKLRHEKGEQARDQYIAEVRKKTRREGRRRTGFSSGRAVAARQSGAP